MSFGQALIAFLDAAIGLLIFVIIVGAVMSWLIAFNVVNPHNQFVRMVWGFTNALTEPLLRPIRRVIPPLGGMDLSPLILLLVLIYFIQGWLLHGVLAPILR